MNDDGQHMYYQEGMHLLVGRILRGIAIILMYGVQRPLGNGFRLMESGITLIRTALLQEVPK